MTTFFAILAAFLLRHWLLVLCGVSLLAALGCGWFLFASAPIATVVYGVVVALLAGIGGYEVGRKWGGG